MGQNDYARLLVRREKREVPPESENGNNYRQPNKTKQIIQSYRRQRRLQTGLDAGAGTGSE